MDSKIMETIDDLFSESKRIQIRQLRQYQKLKKDIEYFESFVDQKDVPPLTEMICKLISTESKLISHTEFRPMIPMVDIFSNNYSFGVFDPENDPINGIILEHGSLGLEIKSMNNYHEERSPTIHINRFGYHIGGGLELAKKGVRLEGYNIPKNVAEVLLNDFTKIEGERNDIIFVLARSEDLAECNSRNAHQKIHKAHIDRGLSPYPGVDENYVYTIEKNSGKAFVFGNVQGYKVGNPNVGIDIRVEIPGERFQFPSERRPGFDITEK